ncbi:MAG: ABC transporter substrate-binding protein [Candidatus Xenobiia bacterium LiM19]
MQINARRSAVLFVIKRLMLGCFLIALASSILLVSDRRKETTHQGREKKASFYFVGYTDTPMTEDCLQGVLDGLNDAGWNRGTDYSIYIHNAQGDMTALNGMIDNVLQEKPDILFTSAIPTLQTALKKVSDIPVVFTNSGDPIAAGAGSSFERHRSNVTGICTMSDFEGMIVLLKDIMPKARRIGTLFVPGEINSCIYKDQFILAAERAGMTIVAVPVNSSAEISSATQTLCSKDIDVICQIADNLTSASIAGIIQQAREEKVPLFAFLSETVKQGAVGAVARDYYQAGIDSAEMALRIMRGRRAADIPIRYVSKTKIILNRDAAKHFGISLRPDILRRADELTGKQEER